MEITELSKMFETAQIMDGQLADGVYESTLIDVQFVSSSTNFQIIWKFTTGCNFNFKKVNTLSTPNSISLFKTELNKLGIITNNLQDAIQHLINLKNSILEVEVRNGSIYIRKLIKQFMPF